ncbi:Piso0_004948 [Millerozyma farinosa CBS 7064]|uniref:Mitochondrial import inner membrane translocase subunit n=1 Tax=Pichia sorbitophila (strain ATCC MYA-4447 / BCRC 22081 / CBS 7064 / NBRC 10061 / NRRL Y-12695) TaxID=559304 RepID=G8Y0V5_PICSO|nr:Piso0_004948 [Millerozyma farinosa CBS 7064]
MSLFMGSAGQYTNASVDPEKIKMAEIHFDSMSKTFNSVLQTCRKKCVPAEYGEAELNTGEQCCVDRCVAKYVKANYQVGSQLQKGLGPGLNQPVFDKIKEKLESEIDSLGKQ